MFGRYTEKARRVIFFARYEASQFGSPQIETEYLLLGLLREDKRLSYSFLGSHVSVEVIRSKIEQHTVIRERVSTSVDLPLSDECKRVLVNAGDEAERLGHKHIGTEHLLLGLLREDRSFAAQLLTEEGVTLEEARRRIAQGPLTAAPAHPVLLDAPTQPWHVLFLRGQIAALKKSAWRKRDWKPLDVLMESDTGRVFFDTTSTDDPTLKLVSGGWPKDSCAICNWEFNIEDSEHSTGYTNGRQWICPKCYEAFLDPSPKSK